MSDERKTTQPQQEVPTSKKMLWSMGSFAETYMNNAVGYLAMPIYQVGLGVDPRWLGLAMGIPRLWEAVSDPLMGNISDNTRTKWGRRKPYIFIGAILCGLFFVLLWSPPAFLSKAGLAVYFFTICILYYTVYTVFTIPWNALGLELANDYHERTRVMSYKTFFAALFGIGIGMVWWLSFKLGIKLGTNVIDGLRKVSPIFGVLIIITGVIPAIFCKEKIITQRRINLFSAIKLTFTNRVFLLLSAITFLILLGLFLVQPFGLYINIHYVFHGNIEPVAKLNMVANAIFQIFGLALVPAVSYIGTKIGKKKTLIGGLMLVIIGYLSCWWTYNPTFPYMQLVSFALIAPGLSCVWVLTASMTADICDLDELKTGMRREGMYGASFAWMCKMGVAGSLLLTGYLLDLAGFQSEVGARQSDSTISMLRALYVLVPAVIIGLALCLTCFYPLSEKRVRQIREELNHKKSLTTAHE